MRPRVDYNHSSETSVGLPLRFDVRGRTPFWLDIGCLVPFRFDVRGIRLPFRFDVWRLAPLRYRERSASD